MAEKRFWVEFLARGCWLLGGVFGSAFMFADRVVREYGQAGLWAMSLVAVVIIIAGDILLCRLLRPRREVA